MVDYKSNLITKAMGGRIKGMGTVFTHKLKVDRTRHRSHTVIMKP